MRAAQEKFLPKPLIKDEFIAALSKIKELVIGYNSEDKKCRIITTFSNKGGIGKTAIATNLALELANINERKSGTD